MRRYCRIRSFLLAGLLAFVISPSTARAVSISLVPDGPTTIEIGETVNIDVFLLLDASDQQAGISAATLHLELGSGFVDVVSSTSGSVFSTPATNVVQGQDFIVFSEFGGTVTSPTALLGSLSIKGIAQGSYDLVGRRFGSFPLFTAPGDNGNRYDFASNEALVITVACSTGACPVGSPSPIEPWPRPPEPPPTPAIPEIDAPDEPPPTPAIPEVDAPDEPPPTPAILEVDAGSTDVLIPSSDAPGVTISLVPDRSTTIGIGETVNVDVFILLDSANQTVGISAATLHIALGSPHVDVEASSSRSVFPYANANVVPWKGFVVFSQFGVTVMSPRALLGSLSITGRAPGSYDLRAIRFGNFPLFTAPGSSMNRYVFTPDQALRITVTCAGCASTDLGPPPPVSPISPPNGPPAAPAIPEVDVGEVASTEVLSSGGQVNLYMKTTLTTITTTDTGSFANTVLNTLTETLPSPPYWPSITNSNLVNGTGVSVNFNIGEETEFNLGDLQFGNNGSTINSADTLVEAPPEGADLITLSTTGSFVLLAPISTLPWGSADLMNPDASAATQEFSLLKERRLGALVGVLTPLDGSPPYFELGIRSAGMTPAEVIALGGAGRSAFEADNNEVRLLNREMADLRELAVVLFPGDVNRALTEEALFAEYDPTFDASPDAGELRGGTDAIEPIATDAWIEPLPWLPDPDQLARGVLVYQVANRNEPDPRCHLQEDRAELFDPDSPVCFDRWGVRKVRTFNDPTDATNPLNVFRAGSGESCIQSFGDTRPLQSGQRTAAFGASCTDLETMSANLERLLIAFDLIGPDGVPDPVESLEELRNILDGNPNNNGGGDPLAGPDGIFVANLATGLGNAATANPNQRLSDPRFEFGEKETHVVRNEARPSEIGIVRLRDFTSDPNDVIAVGNIAELSRASENFMEEYDPATCLQASCHLVIAEDHQLTQVEFNEVIATGLSKELVTVIPVALRVDAVKFDDAGNVTGPGPTHINLLKLYYQDPVTFSSLLADPDPNDPFVSLEIDGKTFGVLPIDRELFLNHRPGQCQDLDADGLCDFDQDDDGVYDGVDDYTAGPTTDDGTFCGSGLWGDVLQDAIQFEFARPSDKEAFATAFPNGLPPRSPVFCGSVLNLLAQMGESSSGQLLNGTQGLDDTDADGWPDLVDTCPFFANPDQGGNSDGDLLCDEEDPCRFFTNTLPLVISGPSGIPDECLCGDFDGDGFHSVTDATAINECAAFLRFDCVSERDEVDGRIDGFCSATDASLVDRVASDIDPAYTLMCERRPEGTCDSGTGVPCLP